MLVYVIFSLLLGTFSDFIFDFISDFIPMDQFVIEYEQDTGYMIHDTGYRRQADSTEYKKPCS